MLHRVITAVSVLLRLSSQCSLSSGETMLEARECSSEHVQSALEETCSCVPRPVVVRLPWPNNTDVHHMTPTHVEVYKCGGGCQSGPSSRSCVASVSRQRSVSVMLGTCGLGPGRCAKQCASIMVREDTQCQCDCDQETQLQCQLSPQHVFRQETCQCMCKDLQARLECQDSGHVWSEATCSCTDPTLKTVIALVRPDDNSVKTAGDGDIINDGANDGGPSITREIIVIILLAVINTCLLSIMSLLIRRLRGLRKEYEQYGDRTVYDYQVNQSQRGVADDSYLKRPKMISNNTYSEIDIYSASSGFVSENGSAKLEQEQCCYESPETVRLKKYQVKEAFKEADKNARHDLTYERAMQSIDETMKMLKESAQDF